MSYTSINSFLRAVAETPTFWQSVRVRIIVVWADGEWHHLVGTAHLDRRTPDAVPRMEALPRLDRLQVLEEALPIASVAKFIRTITKRGVTTVQGTAVRFFRAEGDPVVGLSFYDRVALPLDDYIGGQYTYGHVVLLQGQSAGNVFRLFPGGHTGFEAALRRAGWLNLNELMWRGLGDALALNESMATRLTFVAPLEATLDHAACRLRDGTFEYAVLASSTEVGRGCVLTVSGEDSRGRRVARSLQLDGRRWGRRKDVYRHRGTIRVGDAPELHLSLHVAGHELGYLSIRAERSRTAKPLLLLAHDALFKKDREFEDVLLRPTDKEGQAFERAVARLFMYAGFICDQPGKVPQESNGPDVLVEVPGRALLIVIEATINKLMNDEKKKLNRLTSRATSLQHELKDRGVEVLGTMAVPWPREILVPVELEQAETNRVRVLCREDLATIYEMLLDGRSARAIAEFVHPAPRVRGRYTIAQRNPLAPAPSRDD